MRLSNTERKQMPTKEFANPKKRRFPLNDKAHIRSARSYERFASPAERAKIDAAAKKAGIGQKTKKEKRSGF